MFFSVGGWGSRVLDAFLIMQLSIIGTMKIFSEIRDTNFTYQTNLVEKIDQSCISLHCNSHHCVHTEYWCHLLTSEKYVKEGESTIKIESESENEIES